MGPYCKFCGNRCFVHRVMPADSTWRPGEPVILATCPRGKASSRDLSGYDADTAINPDERPDAAAEAPATVAAALQTWQRAQAWKGAATFLLQAAAAFGFFAVLLAIQLFAVSLTQDGIAARHSPLMPYLLTVVGIVVLLVIAGGACAFRAINAEEGDRQ